MRRGLLVVLLSLALITMGLSACSSKGTTVEVKAPEVSFTSAYAIVGNTSVVPIQTQFNVTNPSNVWVKLDSLEFSLKIDDLNVGNLQIPCNYGIAAGDQISVSGVVLVSFSPMVQSYMFGQGLSQGNATMKALPYWKKVGGTLPSDSLKPVWDPIDPKATWTASGTAYIEGDGQRLSTDFSKTLAK